MNHYYDQEAAAEAADMVSVGSSSQPMEDEEEEFRPEDYPLPPLPPVTAPESIHGCSTAEVYSIIKELRRQLGDPVECERAKAMLLSDTKVLLAVTQVLHEANVLRRSVVNDHGAIEEQLVPQPEAAQPQLPTGYHSWITEEPNRYYR